MGHEILVYRDKHAIIHDMDLWMIRHFLVVEAEETDKPGLASFVAGWNRIGPGVFLGMDFDDYLRGEQDKVEGFVTLIQDTRQRIKLFGLVIPLDYLEANVNLALLKFLSDQSTDRLIRQLTKIQDLFIEQPRSN